jgi:hypothetical protein
MDVFIIILLLIPPIIAPDIPIVLQHQICPPGQE